MSQGILIQQETPPFLNDFREGGGSLLKALDLGYVYIFHAN